MGIERKGGGGGQGRAEGGAERRLSDLLLSATPFRPTFGNTFSYLTH